MRNMLIATAAAALCAALPAAAAPQTNDQAAQPSQPRARAGNDDQRRICVTEQASESRINRRICRTAREWREANDTNDQR
jgi:Ni/Co efflux regulator RcnB